VAGLLRRPCAGSCGQSTPPPKPRIATPTVLIKLARAAVHCQGETANIASSVDLRQPSRRGPCGSTDCPPHRPHGGTRPFFCCQSKSLLSTSARRALDFCTRPSGAFPLVDAPSPIAVVQSIVAATRKSGGTVQG
jgi:hypothetical protein